MLALTAERRIDEAKQAWDCNGQSNQQWRFNADGTITAAGANKCLDVPNSSTANGVKLQIWSCGGAANQRWTRVGS